MRPPFYVRILFMTLFGTFRTGILPVAWRLHRFGCLGNTSLVQLRMELEIRDLELRKTVSCPDHEDTVIETFTQNILYNYVRTQRRIV